MAVDPIEQFQIHNLFPIAKIGNTEIAFTNSAAFMLVAVLGLTAFLVSAHGGAQSGALAPAIGRRDRLRIRRHHRALDRRLAKA